MIGPMLDLGKRPKPSAVLLVDAEAEQKYHLQKFIFVCRCSLCVMLIATRHTNCIGTRIHPSEVGHGDSEQLPLLWELELLSVSLV